MALPISVLLLNHRQDERLVQCLESVRWADEVIVFDYHSHFNWQKWHKKFKLTVIQKDKAVANFAEARNELLTHARHEWVFFIDSDEVCNAFSEEVLKNLISNPKAAGYTVKRQDIFFGKTLRWGEVGNVWLLRLARKKNIVFSRAVHEQAQIKGKTVKSDLIISHYAHQSINAFFDKIWLYAEIEAYLRPKNSFSSWRLLFFPPGKLAVNLVVKGGILDGWRGIVYAVMMSLHSLWVSVFLYEKQSH